MRTNEKEAETDRALLVLTREVRRMDEAAERVRLVVKAMALRRGIAVETIGGSSAE